MSNITSGRGEAPQVYTSDNEYNLKYIQHLNYSNGERSDVTVSFSINSSFLKGLSKNEKLKDLYDIWRSRHGDYINKMFSQLNSRGGDKPALNCNIIFKSENEFELEFLP